MGRGHTSATVTNPEADFFNQSVGEVKEKLWASDLICEVLRFRNTGGVRKILATRTIRTGFAQEVRDIVGRSPYRNAVASGQSHLRPDAIALRY